MRGQFWSPVHVIGAIVPSYGDVPKLKKGASAPWWFSMLSSAANEGGKSKEKLPARTFLAGGREGGYDQEGHGKGFLVEWRKGLCKCGPLHRLSMRGMEVTECTSLRWYEQHLPKIGHCFHFQNFGVWLPQTLSIMAHYLSCILDTSLPYGEAGNRPLNVSASKAYGLCTFCPSFYKKTKTVCQKPGAFTKCREFPCYFYSTKKFSPFIFGVKNLHLCCNIGDPITQWLQTKALSGFDII